MEARFRYRVITLLFLGLIPLSELAIAQKTRPRSRAVESNRERLNRHLRGLRPDERREVIRKLRERFSGPDREAERSLTLEDITWLNPPPRERKVCAFGMKGSPHVFTPRRRNGCGCRKP